MADYPDATLVELHALLPNKENVTVPTLHNFLKRLKISWKKTLCVAERHRQDVLQERIEWKNIQDAFDVTRFVFIDAVLSVTTPPLQRWTKTNRTPLYGRVPIGKRLIDYVPHGHWKTTTFMAALRQTDYSAV